MVHTNIHCAHQGKSRGTYKHAFSHHKILHCTRETFILHTIAYCIAHSKHSYCTPVYKTRLSLELCHSCVRFLLSVLSISPRRVACELWVPQTASVTATNGICRNELLDAHMGSALVRDVVMQKTQHKTWLPQLTSIAYWKWYFSCNSYLSNLIFKLCKPCHPNFWCIQRLRFWGFLILCLISLILILKLVDI